MKFCSVCGKQYPDDAMFCGRCGLELKVMKQKQINSDSSDKKNEGAQVDKTINNIINVNISDENIAKVKNTANEVVTTIKSIDVEKSKVLVEEYKNKYNALPDNKKLMVIIFFVSIIVYAGYSFLSPAMQVERVTNKFMSSIVKMSESDGIDLSALEDMAECLEPKYEGQVRMMISMAQFSGLDELAKYSSNPFSTEKIAKWEIINTDVRGDEATVIMSISTKKNHGYNTERGKIKLNKMKGKWRITDMSGI